MKSKPQIQTVPKKSLIAMAQIFPLCLLTMSTVYAADVQNIVNPNANGLSHNKVNNFDVTTNGKVLNNATTTVKTQLAGDVNANPLLEKSASTILFDVTNPQKNSQLNGALELAGNKAGFILANAYGISCNSCSFINFSRVALVGGTAVVQDDGKLIYKNIQGGVDVNGAGLSTDSDLSVLSKNLRVNGALKAQNVDVYVTSSDAKAIAEISLASTGSMYANRITLQAPQTNALVQLNGAIESKYGFDAQSGGNLNVNQTVLAESGDLNLTGANVNIGKTKLVSGANIGITGNNLRFASTGVRALGDIVLNASENIYSSASEGTGWVYKEKPAEQKITESVIDVFKLNIGEKFSINTKTGNVTVSESGIKVGTSVAEAMKILQGAPGLSGTEIGKAFVKTVVDKTASESIQNIDSAAFEAGGSIRRTAGKGIYDQATTVTAAKNIEQSAQTIVTSGYTRMKLGDAETDTDKETLAGGMFFKGLLPGAYLQWEKNLTESTVQTQQWGQKGANYVAGGDFKSVTTESSFYNGASIAAAGNTDIKAKSVTMDGLKITEDQNGLTQGLDLKLRGEIGFFGLGASGRIGVRFGGSDGVYNALSTTKVTSGGNFAVTTDGDQRYVGTEISAGGKTDLNAGGKVSFEAATARLNEVGRAVNIGLSGGAGITWDGLEFKLGGDLSANLSDRQRTTETAGKLSSGGDVTIQSAGDLTLNGTKLESKNGDVNLISKGKLTVAAATDETHVQVLSGGVDANVSFGVGWTGTPTVGFEIAGNFGLAKEETVTKTTASISAKNKLNIQSAGNAYLEGTNLTAGSDLAMNVGGQLNYDAATNNANSGAGTVAGKFGVKIGSSLGLNVGVSGAVAMKDNTTEQRGVVRAKNLFLTVGDKANFVGTDIRAKELANVDVAGNLYMESAQRRHVEGSAKAGFGLGLSIGLGAVSTMTPSFSLNFGATARSLQYNFNGVIQGDTVNLKVGKNLTLDGAVVQANNGVNQNLGGKLAVFERKDWAVGAGFDFSFGQTFLSKPGSSIGVSPSLSFQQSGTGTDQWTKVGGGLKLDLPTGTSIGFSGYVETAPVTQKPSGIFSNRIVIEDKSAT